jgi:acetolactate synthase-1/2/3 large subunit
VGNGTANALNNVFNAARQNVPMLLAAGRSPILESGFPASRNNFIHWAQELFDQGGMLRELVKWDYELRHPLQVRTVVDRALAISRTAPQGPVYLVLPREVLAEPCELPPVRVSTGGRPAHAPATEAHPDPAAVLLTAQWLREARSPLIVTAEAGRGEAAFDALGRIAQACAIPVVEYRARFANLPSGHPMYAGGNPNGLVPKADLILVVDCDVPWLPSECEPAPDARVVHIGSDPLFARYPVRSFPCDLAITGAVGPTLDAIAAAMDPLPPGVREEIDTRRAGLARAHAAARAQRLAYRPDRMDAAWVSRCIDGLRDEDTVLLSEYPLWTDYLTQTRFGCYFSLSSAGGLGWCTGAALGVKLARPANTVIAAVGDGAYLFGNPTPTHMASRAHNLPVLWVVFNNRGWAAVHQATRTVYPEGAAAGMQNPPFTSLQPDAEYERIVEAAGGWGARVEDPQQLPSVLAQALHIVKNEGRQALVNVIAPPL